ncbi:hypothetical protein RHMOL_Rhmol06G0274200 [Rhododendron molle]|uniref:Uncharacterized protein n=1 Tax=Rhododendron molle TaxID=49168 RepID=A0ACC0NGZ9_RHOML|nr:hypothetical protein RHMOL_Rhmol06G0274200 [Rhododendron molle]
MELCGALHLIDLDFKPLGVFTIHPHKEPVAEGNEQTCCASLPEAKQSPATETCIIEEQPCLITSEETCCASIPEAKQSPATETCIIEEQPCLITSEEKARHSKVSVIVDQPSVAEKRNQSKDLEQKSMRIEEAPVVHFLLRGSRIGLMKEYITG